MHAGIFWKKKKAEDRQSRLEDSQSAGKAEDGVKREEI